MLRDPMKREAEMGGMSDPKRSRMMVNGPMGMMPGGGMMSPMANQGAAPMQSTPVRPTKVK